ncbi:MAG: T9SS type A sorting domain-containing protein [Saprospiraceae bacterium]|nr:T9SS type A sorting domain-containing protein [Saprospiraceae bacterium]
MKNFSLLLLLLVVFLSCTQAQQPTTVKTANDFVLPYKGSFGYGSNMGYYAPHRDEAIADFAARAGVRTMRPAMFEHFVEYWGYDIRIDAFKHYEALGMKDHVLFIGYPSKAHRDNTVYCGKDSSVLFANMYEPIWDNGENGTPVNDNNYYALYVWKTVKTYGKWIKFWEIWNEPDYANTFKTMLPAGTPGSWWTSDPDPCEYALHAPVQHYIRLLRISYEVIKKADPTAYVCTGGIGFPSFLDAICRQTDNPNGGAVTPQYPLKGGAYFDVLSYHSYPHIDGSVREWSDKLNGFAQFRHSDRAVEGVFKQKSGLETVLKKHGYDGTKYPNKHFIITESNIPAKEKDEFMGSYQAQRNFLIKSLIKSQLNGLLQFHVYSVGELAESHEMKSEFDLMGLYSKLENTPKEKVRMQESGIGYTTTSDILRGYHYDAMETQMLNLPTEADGAAFRNDSTGDIVYCLWAKTNKDRSEEAELLYSFPTNLNISHVQKREWNYSQTYDVQILNSKFIKLTGTPAFFRKGQLELKNMPEKESIYCFPSPADSELFINYRLDKEAVANLQIYDVGKRQYIQLFSNQTTAAGTHQWHINTEGYENGLYIVQLNIGRQGFSKKVYIAK